MSNFTRYASYLSALGCILASSPVVRAAGIELGRGRVETSLSARADYDSNIFLNNGQTDDFTATANARARYIHDVGILSAEAAIDVTAVKYTDHTSQDTIDPSFTGNLTYRPSDKTTATADASVARNTMANEAVNDRTKSTDTSLNFTFQNLFSEKLGFRVLGGTSLGNYLTTGYVDIANYNVGAKAVYAYSPKLTSTAGIDYRESWTRNRQPGQIDPSSKDYRYTIGFEGELAPKVSGVLELGAVQRKFNTAGVDGSTAAFLSMGLKWIAAQKTSVSLNGSEDFGLTAANQSSKVTSFSLGVTQVLDPKWTVDAGISYAHSAYQSFTNSGDFDRTDDIYRIRGRISYAMATNVALDLSAGYANADSSAPVSAVAQSATYDRVNVGVGVTVSF